MPAKEKIPIEGLLESYGAALTQTGYSITTKLLLVRRAELLIQRHLNAGLVYFYQAVINRYVSEIFALPSMLRGARQELTPKFEQIAEEFIAGDFHPNTRCDIRWVTYKYFAWLEGQGFRGITGVGAVHIQKFLLACSEQDTPSTIHNVRLYLWKWFHTPAEDAGPSP